MGWPPSQRGDVAQAGAPHYRDGAAVPERWSSGTSRWQDCCCGHRRADDRPRIPQVCRADRIFALEPLLGEERGDGRRTRVWVEGVADPIIASRTERAILHDMGQEAATDASLVDEALDLASRLAQAAEVGRVDLNDLGRRARRLLAATTVPE